MESRAIEVGAKAGRVLWAVVFVAALVTPSARSGDLAQEGDGAAAGSGIELSCVAELESALDALDAGDGERALSHYRAALGMATSDTLRFQALLGLSLLFAGDRDGAVAQYVRLKDLDPALAQDLHRRVFP